ncbi:hypothetical protein DERF_013890 [Dermatophagoides farinae]|uniref:Uncharacterized protein n=1 Tax=Dermatophagoides farinae TaxID=6954 RepID=A0A922HQJ2_DERFA|nr:hypothetical protein DERF_013890 [Dermatophagoides farinae]
MSSNVDSSMVACCISTFSPSLRYVGFRRINSSIIRSCKDLPPNGANCTESKMVIPSKIGMAIASA